ncbi:MAG: hypothetical protein JXB24_04070 [Bacteroidales bacterium]|nr:hypothetical protein [Bacteroidales bacterium]
MKKFLLTYLLILLAVCVFGQSSKSERDNIRKQKVDFFNKKLNLSNTEADNFWTVYNDYQNRKNKISSEKRALIRYYMQNADYMSKNEITETLEKYLFYEKQETDLLVIYSEKLRKVLPDEKVLKVYVTEVEFKDYLLKQLRTK